ncbi:MAG: hypothetical protein WCS37_16975 [Chloroflexota bacterium]
MEQSDPNLSIIPSLEQEVVPSLSDEDFAPAENIVEAEWVVRYRAHRRKGWLRWLNALFQMAVALWVAWLFFIIPLDPSTGPFYNWKNPVIIFVLICFIGKTLIDTLFYDHYQP